MRIPFPKSIPMRPLIVFLGIVMVIQNIEGTDPIYAALMMIAQVAAAVAFNDLGGMTHMTGAFCLFSVLPNVTVPELTHAVFLQPGDYHVEAPVATAGVCAVFYLCVMASAKVATSIRHPEPFLDRIPFSLLELRTLSVVASVTAFFIMLGVLNAGYVEEGTTLAFMQHFFGLLIVLSVILATYVRLKSTNGVSCMNWYVALLLAVAIIPGILTASKEFILTPMFAWLIVCAAHRYSFGKFQIVALVSVLAVAWIFVYPFSQNARVPIRSAETTSEKISIIERYFSDPSSFTQVYDILDDDTEFGNNTKNANIIQRYSLLYTDGLLVKADLNNAGYTDIGRYLPALYAVIPHSLWPGRPEAIRSNEIGHKAGFRMGEEDTTTGLAIGAPSLFFDLGGWPALMVYTLIIFFLFFVVNLRFVGLANRSIWGLLLVGLNGNLAGAASPALMFYVTIQFVVTLIFLVCVLKVISYFSQTLITRTSLS